MRMKYDPNNVLMLPMPSESYKITVNILTERKSKEDRGKEVDVIDVIDMADGNDINIPSTTSKNDSHNDCHNVLAEATAAKKKTKKLLSRQRVHYFETLYDFYGMCSDLYQKVAEYLEVDVACIDLIIKVRGEFDTVGDENHS